MKAYKGFDKNMSCLGFQFEEGKEYKTDKAKLCSEGFHACENPLDCLSYYAPGISQYREVILDDVSDEKSDDSKRVGKTIKIGAEISIKCIVEAGIKFIFGKVDWSCKNETGDHGASQQTGYQGASQQTGNNGASQQTGDHGASQQTGYQGASQQTGHHGASQQTGYRGASQQTGYQGASQQTGNYGASVTTGYQSRSSIENGEKPSIGGFAVAVGPDSKVRAPIGCYLVTTEWDKECENIINAKLVKVDGKRIKAGVWYQLKGGKFVECK